jgi:hypothetical protein
MTAKDILAFQFGRADAIRTVASSSSAIWTGIVLVLLTAFARNYDQTYIPEKPFLWFFGPLLFSVVSGTWLFLITYGLCARLKMPDVDYARRPPLWRYWRGFMGAFWMTAPIAWLYAIPVERFFDSLTAAKANVALLAIVSLWRVLLMARVLQVVCSAPFVRTLLWVIAAASVEVIVLVVAGGTYSKRIMAAMGGMRNSPEEQVLVRAFVQASELAFWGFIIAFCILAVWRWRGIVHQWPALIRSRMPVWFLAVAAIAWVLVAWPNQVTVRRNFSLEQHIAKERWREALDLMSTHDPAAFAPARPLPPKLYELSMFQEVLGLAGALRADDPAWVRAHVANGLAVMRQHFGEMWLPGGESGADDPERIETLLGWRIKPQVILPLLQTTNLAPEVMQWLAENPGFVDALLSMSQDPDRQQNHPDWLVVAEVLSGLVETNATFHPPSDSVP